MEQIIINTLSLLFGGLISWVITHCYYKKGLETQEAEFTKERRALIGALEKSNAIDGELLKQRHIDQAVTAWRSQGTAVPYLDSLTSLSNEEKSAILRSASLRHKKREPKNNPYAV